MNNEMINEMIMINFDEVRKELKKSNKIENIDDKKVTIFGIVLWKRKNETIWDLKVSTMIDGKYRQFRTELKDEGEQMYDFYEILKEEKKN